MRCAIARMCLPVAAGIAAVCGVGSILRSADEQQEPGRHAIEAPSERYFAGELGASLDGGKPAARVLAVVGAELVALNAATGEELWKTKIADEELSVVRLTVACGTVYVDGIKDGEVRALSALSGEKRWSFAQEGRELRVEAADAKTVYISSTKRNTPAMMHAIHCATGKELWFHTGKGERFSAARIAPAGVLAITFDQMSSRDDWHGVYLDFLNSQDGGSNWNLALSDKQARAMVVTDNNLYASRSDGALSCLAMSDGKERWAVEFDTTLDVGQLALFGETLLVMLETGGGSKVMSLGADTGKQRWSFETGRHNIVVADCTAEFVAVDCSPSSILRDGTVQILSATTGKEVSSYTAPAEDEWRFTRFFGDGQVLCAGETVFAFGVHAPEKKWGAQCKRLYLDGAVYGGWVFVSLDDCSLAALDAKSGTEAWNYCDEFKNTVYSPLVAHDRVYAQCGGHGLAALNMATGKPAWERVFKGELESLFVVAD